MRPKDYEGTIRLLHERHEAMNKTYQPISVFQSRIPNDLAVLSVNAIAQSFGIQAPSFARLAHSLRYAGFKDLQKPVQKRLATLAPVCPVQALKAVAPPRVQRDADYRATRR